MSSTAMQMPPQKTENIFNGMKQFIQSKPNQTTMHALEALDMQLHLTVYLQ